MLLVAPGHQQSGNEVYIVVQQRLDASVIQTRSMLDAFHSGCNCLMDGRSAFDMGCNISTFIDTLFASLLLATPLAFTVVLTEMLSVAIISTLVLLLGYRHYQAGIEAVLERVVRSRASLVVFIVIITLIPLALIALT